jgi:S1-C subfamily serine protease
MNPVTLIVLLIALAAGGLAHPERARAWEIPRDITFIGLEGLAAEAKKPVFLLESAGRMEDGGQPGKVSRLGTGFLVSVDRTVVGVTCEHLVRGASEAGREISIAIATEKGPRRVRVSVLATDEERDLALLSVAQAEKAERPLLAARALPLSRLGGRGSIAEGRGVVVPGYPLGIRVAYDEDHPVMQFGIVAQFTGGSSLLVDGVASPGSCGSPVFEVWDGKLIGMIRTRPAKTGSSPEREEAAASVPYSPELGPAVTADEIGKVLRKSVPR